MKNIFIAILFIVMLPLLFASITNSGDSGNQELKGFSARDIQVLTSMGFVDNNDGSYSITMTGLQTMAQAYYFDYMPYNINGLVIGFKTNNSTSGWLLFLGGRIDTMTSGQTYTLWGGDVS